MSLVEITTQWKMSTIAGNNKKVSERKGRQIFQQAKGKCEKTDGGEAEVITEKLKIY